MRILVIEDDRTTARTLRAILKDVSSYIGIADTGEEGIARTKEESYELVVLDLSLPDMHGLDVIRRIRASNTDAPILVLTGDMSMEMSVNCLEAGADDYLKKPLHAADLIARVHAIWRRSVESTKLTVQARN